MTFKRGNITTTILDGGTRISNGRDTLLVERADLDDAIMALCEVKRLQDPEGYQKLVDKFVPLHDDSNRAIRWQGNWLV